MTRRQLRAPKNLCADVIGNDFDLTHNKFSYKPLKELETKVPEFFWKLYLLRYTGTGESQTERCELTKMEGGALRRRTKVRRCRIRARLAELAPPLVRPSVDRTYLTLPPPFVGYPLSTTGAGSFKPGATPQG